MTNRQERRRRLAVSRKDNVGEGLAPILASAVAAEQKQDYPGAQHLYETAVKMAPTDVQAVTLLAAFYYRIKRLRDAMRWFKEAIRLQPNMPDNFFNLGKVLNDLGSHEEAETQYKAALAINPGHMLTLNNLGNLILNRGETKQAIKLFKTAIDLDPNHPFAYHNLANALLKKGDTAAALSVTEQGLVCSPKNHLLWFVRGNALLHRKQWIEAITAYQKAQQAGSIPGLKFNLGICYLMEKSPNQALACFEEALLYEPRRMDIHAYKAIALTESAQIAGASVILDYDRLLKQSSILDAEGYPDWVTYAQALTQDILSHPSLEWERSTTATRGGGHTGSLLENPTRALQATERMIRREVDHYISTLPHDVYPAFLNLTPRQYRINLWAVVIEETGYQIPHLHSSGWLSGVFYLQVPSSIRADDARHAGWIEFGQPGYDLPYSGQYTLKKIFPEPGKLMLFPSYVFHRTIPTIGKDRRISVAFDIVPYETGKDARRE